MNRGGFVWVVKSSVCKSIGVAVERSGDIGSPSYSLGSGTLNLCQTSSTKPLDQGAQEARLVDNSGFK